MANSMIKTEKLLFLKTRQMGPSGELMNLGNGRKKPPGSYMRIFRLFRDNAFDFGFLGHLGRAPGWAQTALQLDEHNECMKHKEKPKKKAFEGCDLVMIHVINIPSSV